MNPCRQKLKILLLCALLLPTAARTNQPSPHKPPEQPGIIAHRGLWNTHNAPQNSLASLIQAAQANLYGSEFDVRITQDGIPIIHHNDSINGLLIESTTWNNLQHIQLTNGEHLPTLQQYLTQAQQFPNLQLLLEIKPHQSEQNNQRAVQAALNLIQSLNMQSQVQFLSFSLQICQYIHQLNPNAPIAYLTGDLPPTTLANNNLTGLSYPQQTLLNQPQWINQAHDLGLTVNVWTVNDSSLMTSFITLGVDFITTDNPNTLQSLLTPQ